ncbi:hypothetical protein [Streptomyces macrosporus]|uniref:hypothetical protein n=1 Tax=Streptomyces macrosporus TaxID=44032 RepID=UPI0031DB6F80
MPGRIVLSIDQETARLLAADDPVVWRIVSAFIRRRANDISVGRPTPPTVLSDLRDIAE